MKKKRQWQKKGVEKQNVRSQVRIDYQEQFSISWLANIFKYLFGMHKVKSILDKKIDQQTSIYESKLDKELFLVQWKKIGSSKLTWEPFQTLPKNCRELLAEFQRKFGHLKTTCIGKVYIPPNKNNRKASNCKTKPIRKTRTSSRAYQKGKKEFEQIQEENMKNNKSSEHEHVENCEKRRILNFPPKIKRKSQKPNDQDELQKKREQSKSKKSEIHSQKISPQPENVSHRISHRDNLSENLSQEVHEIQHSLNFSHHSIQSKKEKEKDKDFELQRKNQSKQQRRWPEQLERASKELLGILPVGAIRIKGMRRAQEDGNTLFLVERKDIRGWFPHSYLLKKNPRDLCLFYQEYIQFM